MTATKRFSVAVVLATALFAPAFASASDADALFKEGRALLDAKKYDEACPKLAESQRLEPGAGTLVALALCHEGQGKTATAHDELRQAADLGRKNGRADLAGAAEKRATAMEPKLSKVVVRQPKGEHYDIALDGNRLTPERADAPFAVDPGDHKIEATGKGKLPRTYVVRSDKPGLTEIVIERLDDVPVAATPAPQPSPILATEPPPVDADASRGSGQRSLGIITIVAGVGAMIVGGVFAVKAVSEKSAADRVCDTKPCNSDAEADGNKRSKDSMNVAIISGAAGTGALMLGAIIYFTAPSRPEAKKASARLVPTATPNQVGMGLVGTF